jgi:beta-lactam-binding protein with PASTA domain
VPQVTLPDVRGQNADDATQTLQGLGLKVETTTFITGDRVYQMSPRAGQVVDVGSTVTLALSFG